jgi:hypothetical protein
MAALTFVTAADSAYFSLLRGLVLSIRHKPEGRDIPIHVIDLGLTDAEGSWLAARGARTVAVGWDYEFPLRSTTPGHMRALLARPHLPRHIPGHDVYFWIDADAWIQDWGAVELYLAGVQRKGAALTPEIDRVYQSNYDGGLTREWMRACYAIAFGEEVAARLGEFPIVNAGVFAIAATSPVWRAWSDALGMALQRSSNFFVEQTALNYVLYTETGFTALPSTCNWHCKFCPPSVEAATGALLSHLLPPTRCGIVHLCGLAKTQDGRTVETLAETVTDGYERITASLWYPRWAEDHTASR